MEKSSKKSENKCTNTTLVSGLVTVLKTPITERYCKVGDIATLDMKNKQIRCGGAWFNFDERWTVQSCNYKLLLDTFKQSPFFF